MESRTVDLAGPVHYMDFGGAGRPVVLVHGLGGSHANWLSVGPRLAEHARVVAVDLVGSGRTPLAGRGAGVEANRAMLDRFIAHVAGDAPVTLVGNSMGGLVSLREAAAVPARVAALVLVDPAAPLAWGAPIDRGVAAVFATYLLPYFGPAYLKRKQVAVGSDATTRGTLKLCAADVSTLDPAVVDAHLALARERTAWPWAHDATTRAARSVVLALARRRTYARAVTRVRAPTLLIHGERDRLVSLAAARALAASRPDWTFEVFEGIGHIPQLEAPARFVDVVERWLATH